MEEYNNNARYQMFIQNQIKADPAILGRKENIMFKVGDRVKYVGKEAFLFDEVGTIIEVHDCGSHGYDHFLVQFDKEDSRLHDGGCYKVKGVDLHCWYVCESNLVLVKRQNAKLAIGTRVRYIGASTFIYGKLGEIVKTDSTGEYYLMRFDIPNQSLHSGTKYEDDIDYDEYKNKCWWVTDKEVQAERKDKHGCSWGYTVIMKDGTKRYFQSNKTVKEFEADIKKSKLDWNSLAWTHEIYNRFLDIRERENPVYYNNWN